MTITTLHMLAIFGIDDIIIIAITAALLVAGMTLLLKKKAPKPNSQPATLTERGAVTQVVIGRRKIAPIFCWASIPWSTGDSPPYYFARGLHVLACGQITKITRVIQDGKVLFDSTSSGYPLTPANTPSDTTFSFFLDKGAKQGLGTARIYWGSEGDAIDDVITAADALNIPSGFPGFVKVVWKPKNLGTGGGVWQTVEYECEFSDGYTPLTQSNEFSDNGSGVLGTNPAHALCQLLTAQWPFGAGLDPNYVDRDSLEALGVTMQGEGLVTNVTSGDGQDAIDLIGLILIDCGIMMSQVGAMLTFRAIRDPGATLPVLGSSVFDPSVPQQTNLTTQSRSTRLTFLYDDRTQNYTPVDIGVIDHGNATLQPTTREIQLPTITDLVTANKVADRRQMEEMGLLSSFTLKGRRGARYLTAGQAIVADGIGTLRITSVTLDPKSANVTIEAMQDAWSVEASSNTPDALIPPDSSNTVAPDLHFDWIEVSPSINVFRIRASRVITGSSIFASTGGSYFQLPNQNTAAAGGVTNQTLALHEYTVNNTVQLGGHIFVTGDASTLGAGDQLRLDATSQSAHNNLLFTVVTAVYDGTTFTDVAVAESIPSPANSTGGTFKMEVREAGPIFTDPNGDAADLPLDLSSDIPSWQAGLQWVLFSSVAGRELCYLRNVVSLGAGLYQLKGLIRAKQSTSRLANPIGAVVYAIPRTFVMILSDALLVPSSLSVKSVPFNSIASEDIGSITAVTHTFT